MSFAYPGGRPVLCDVTLQALAGQITMLLGQSGSGKTTLLKIAKGLLRPVSGAALALGEPVRARPERGRLDPRVAFIPQHLGLVRSRSALENAVVGGLAADSLRSALGPSAEQSARARSLLEALGVARRAEAPVRSLSGGERQRVAIARALMQRPRVLLADEFVSQLDPATTADTMEIVRQIAADGVAILMTTHELALVTRYADATIVLRAGRTVLERRGPGLRVDEIGTALGS